MSLDFFPDDPNELDAIPYLLANWNCIGTHIPLLPETKGSDPAGIFQPPILWWLLAARRTHVIAHQKK
jgi:hypothetical protein